MRVGVDDVRDREMTLGNVLGHGLGRARGGAGAFGLLVQHWIDDDPAAGVMDHVT
jgi:hypothetical protein